MLNLLNQSKIWIAVALLASAPVFAQRDNAKCRPQKSFEQGHELSQSQLIAGYNAPASIDVRDSWDVYATASYLYWQARQENIEIGLISANNADGSAAGTGDTPFTTSYPNNITITNPNFTYRPGFKFGLGAKLGWDGWDAFAEYTWFHGGIGSGVQELPLNTSTTLPNGKFLYAIQGEDAVGYYYRSANQSWRLKMDFLDLTMGRSYYSGTKLTMHPFFGVRAAWIRQTLKTTYNGSTNFSGANNTNGFYLTTNHDSSVSWGIGPRAGFESNWLLGYGVRLIGDGAADLLYTRYETRQNDQTTQLNPVTPGANPIAQNASVSQTVDYLRAHVDLEMGFGWASYFDNDNWHVDLSATYGFQIFWDQNMIRNFENTLNAPAKSFAPNGNLYVHGLTLNARLDF